MTIPFPTFWNVLPFLFSPLDLILFHKKNIASGSWGIGLRWDSGLGLFSTLLPICPLLATSPSVREGGCYNAVGMVCHNHSPPPQRV